MLQHADINEGQQIDFVDNAGDPGLQGPGVGHRTSREICRDISLLLLALWRVARCRRGRSTANAK